MTIAEDLMINKELNQTMIDIENFNINEELAKFDEYEIYGYQVLVRLFNEDNTYARDSLGRKTSLVMPENAPNKSIYTSVSGLIVKTGPEAFKGKAFDATPVYPCVGQWVLLPRGVGLEHQYKNMPMKLLEDHLLLTAGITNPQFFKK